MKHIRDLFGENKKNTGKHLPDKGRSRCPDRNETKNARFRRQLTKLSSDARLRVYFVTSESVQGVKRNVAGLQMYY